MAENGVTLANDEEQQIYESGQGDPRVNGTWDIELEEFQYTLGPEEKPLYWDDPNPWTFYNNVTVAYFALEEEFLLWLGHTRVWIILVEWCNMNRRALYRNYELDPVDGSWINIPELTTHTGGTVSLTRV